MIKGEIVDKYTINDEISGGKGYFAFVYKAIDNTSQVAVALKVLKDSNNQENKTRFINENTTLSKLSPHKNIIKAESLIIEYAPNEYCYAMELADKSLEGHLYSNKNLSFSEKMDIFKGVCDGVEHAHGLKVSHRDLHVGNVLLKLDDTLVVKLSDFGLAKDFDSDFFTNGDNPCWGFFVKPPEIAFGVGTSNPNISQHIYGDMYALGILLCFLFGVVPKIEISGIRQSINNFLVTQSSSEKPNILYENWLKKVPLDNQKMVVTLLDNNEHNVINTLLSNLTNVDFKKRFKSVSELKLTMNNLNI